MPTVIRTAMSQTAGHRIDYLGEIGRIAAALPPEASYSAHPQRTPARLDSTSYT